MMLDRMEGNAELKTSVQQMLATRRLTHSVLLVGEAGLGTGFAGMSAAAVISPMLITFLDMDPYMAVGIAVVCAGIVAAVLISRQLQNTQAQTQKQKDEKSAYHRKKGGK